MPRFKCTVCGTPYTRSTEECAISPPDGRCEECRSTIAMIDIVIGRTVKDQKAESQAYMLKLREQSELREAEIKKKVKRR